MRTSKSTLSIAKHIHLNERNLNRSKATAALRLTICVALRYDDIRQRDLRCTILVRRFDCADQKYSVSSKMLGPRSLLICCVQIQCTGPIPYTLENVKKNFQNILQKEFKNEPNT